MTKNHLPPLIPVIVFLSFLFACKSSEITSSKEVEQSKEEVQDEKIPVRINHQKIIDSLNNGNPIFLHLAEDVSIELNIINNVPSILNKVFPNVVFVTSTYKNHYFIYNNNGPYDLEDNFNEIFAKFSNSESISLNDKFQAYAQTLIGFESIIKFNSITEIDTSIDYYNTGKFWDFNYKINALVAGTDETIFLKYKNNEIYYMCFLQRHIFYGPETIEKASIKMDIQNERYIHNKTAIYKKDLLPCLECKTIADSLKQGFTVIDKRNTGTAYIYEKEDYVPEILLKVFPYVVFAASYSTNSLSNKTYCAFVGNNIYGIGEFSRLYKAMPHYAPISFDEKVEAIVQLLAGFESAVSINSYEKEDVKYDNYPFNYKINATINNKENQILLLVSDDEFKQILNITTNKGFLTPMPVINF